MIKSNELEFRQKPHPPPPPPFPQTYLKDLPRGNVRQTSYTDAFLGKFKKEKNMFWKKSLKPEVL
jgi:hypothetical protein